MQLLYLLLLLLRFIIDDPSEEQQEETPEKPEDEESKKWATKGQVETLKSSLETKLDQVWEVLTGSRDVQEPKSATLLTPAATDDELTKSASASENPTEPETSEIVPLESAPESSGTLTNKRKPAIWEPKRNNPLGVGVDQKEVPTA